MIMDPISPQKKKKVNAVVLTLGVLALIFGFIPGFISYKTGLIVFVFSLVIVGIVKVILPDPEAGEEVKPEDQSLPQAPV